MCYGPLPIELYLFGKLQEKGWPHFHRTLHNSVWKLCNAYVQIYIKQRKKFSSDFFKLRTLPLLYLLKPSSPSFSIIFLFQFSKAAFDFSDMVILRMFVTEGRPLRLASASCTIVSEDATANFPLCSSSFKLRFTWSTKPNPCKLLATVDKAN